MRPRLSFLGLSLRILPATLLLSLVAGAQTTTFTGTVYSPKGLPNGSGNSNTGGDPIPNILVFAADPNSPLPVFTPGQVLPTGSQTGCEVQQNLVPASVLGSATSDYKGNFSFTTSGALPNPVTIVIQAGKWRRQYQFDSTVVTPGATNVLPALLMPAAQGTGSDLPRIAISTGSVDALECIFHQIGISDTEITGPDGTGSINLYKGSLSGGEIAPTDYATPSESTLLADPNQLAKYDVVMFGCQGNVVPTSDVPVADISNLMSFAGNGGRIFATHYNYYLLQQPPFSTTATFTSGSASGTALATINTTATFPQGTTLANWIDYIGADYNNTYAQIDLNDVAKNVVSTNTNTTQVWATLNTGGKVMQFTFDTPLGATGAPTVSIGYTNTSTTFLQGDTSDSITVNITNNSSADADSSLTLTLTLPPGVTANSIAGGFGTGWACNVSTLICTRTASNAPLPAGASDNVTVTFSIAANATPGQQSVVAILNGGGLSGTNQCGRVLFNDYHVEAVSGATNKVYPAACPSLSGAIIDQVKFLEYSLYNLSNFVAPSTTDLIDIQGPTVNTWSALATVYYGTPLNTTQLDAVATDSANTTTVPGTFVYTTPSATLTAGEILDAGTYNITATFSPTDPVSYTSGSPVQESLTVLPDPTTTTLVANPASTPAGQTVTLTATTADTYYTTQGQTVTFYDGSAVLGSSTIDATGTATYTINTFSLGSHLIKACLIQTQDYLPSCSSLTPESITVPGSTTPTATLIASSLNPSVVGQPVTFTANVATTNSFTSTPTGLVTFSDGSTVLGTGMLNAGVVTFTTSALAAGTHNITAAYAGTTTTFNASTSTVLAQVVASSVTSAGTGFLMTVTPTTFNIGSGATATLGVTVQAFNSFNVPVTLSCSGLPAESSCVFANSTIPVGGGNTTVNVFVAAPHSCGANTLQASTPRGLPILALVTFVFFARRRRALKGAVLALLLCVIPAVTGCGNCTDLGVKPATYNFTITGTATTNGATPVVSVPGDAVNGSTVTQTQAMTMTVTI